MSENLPSQAGALRKDVQAIRKQFVNTAASTIAFIRKFFCNIIFAFTQFGHAWTRSKECDKKFIFNQSLVIGNNIDVGSVSEETTIHRHSNSLIPGVVRRMATSVTDRRSVNNVLQPTTCFVTTEAYENCRVIAENAGVLIFHVHGYPGTGKSEIVKKLADDLDQFNNGICIKWHIECTDKSQDLETEFGKLMKNLKGHHLITRSIKFALESLKSNQTKPFVELLNLPSVPTLIIIEDPKDEATELLSEFLRCVCKLEKERAGSCPFHVYITTRKNFVSMPKKLLERMQSYEDYNVEGFTEKEALEYLFMDKEITDVEKEAALKIYERLSGTILGLIAVKATCERSRISYSTYHRNSLHEQLDIFTYKKEEKHLQEEYGKHYKHLFQSITLLLEPKDDESDEPDDSSKLIWNVMTSLAFLHHGNIPQKLLARITQILRRNSDAVDVTAGKNEIQSGELITALENFGICKVTFPDMTDFKVQTISFHEVVLHAVRLKLKCGPSKNLYEMGMKIAVISLSGIVHKDLRKTEDNVYMNKISPQIQTLLGHVKNDFVLDSKTTLTRESFIMWMCVCHLLEVLGIVTSLSVLKLKKLSEGCFHDATQILIKTMHSLTQTSPDLNILESKSGKITKDVATTVFRLCDEAGKRLNSDLDENTLDEYISIVLQMKPKELDFLENRAVDKLPIQEARKREQLAVGLDKEMMEQLRKSGKNFLNRSSHCRMFFVERLSSILHTWGRMLLYYNTKITPNLRDHFKWFSMLSHEISVECREQIHLKTLFEHLTSISIVPIMLKGLGKDEQKFSVYWETKAILQRMLDHVGCSSRDAEAYEHGHVKETGADYDAIFVRRFMVRINARLVEIVPPDDEKFFRDADNVCETLYDLSVQNIDWIMSPKCIVYCGKYYASKKDFRKAADCFLTALKADMDQSMNLYAWACYNYSRATACGRVVEHKSNAIERCSKLLKNPVEVDDELVTKVQQQYELLLSQQE